MNSAFSIIFTVCLFGILSSSNAQTRCTGRITGGTFSDISVSRFSCTLESVNVTGSIILTNGGSLATEGDTVISGNITCIECGDITLQGTTSVEGTVFFETSGGVVSVGAGSSVSVLAVSGTASAFIKGSVGGMSTSNNGVIVVDGGRISSSAYSSASVSTSSSGTKSRVEATVSGTATAKGSAGTRPVSSSGLPRRGQ